MRRIGLIVVLVLGALVIPGAASAQQYPITEEAVVQNFGAQRPGDAFDKQDCGFQQGTVANIRLNQTPAGTKGVERDGCVRLRVEIVDRNTVRIDGRPYQPRCGSNSIFVSAPTAGGRAVQRVAENRFNLVCGRGVAAGTLPRTGTDATDLAALGGVLVVIGATVVTIVRRRRAVDPTATA